MIITSEEQLQVAVFEIAPKLLEDNDLETLYNMFKNYKLDVDTVLFGEYEGDILNIVLDESEGLTIDTVANYFLSISNDNVEEVTTDFENKTITVHLTL